MPDLTHLDLSDNLIRDENATRLLTLALARLSLKWLSLADNLIDWDQWIHRLAPVLGAMSSLEDLDLRDTGLDYADRRELARHLRIEFDDLGTPPSSPEFCGNGDWEREMYCF